MNSKKAAIIPEALMIAIQKILHPLVRLLLNFRIAFPQLAEMLKSVYVEIADNEFKLPNKKQTDTRLSLLTGIHRKDIKRLRYDVVTDQKTPTSVDISTRIIARWLAEAFYLDVDKKPLKLPLQADENKPSFQSLVQDICKRDIRPRVVLDEWLRLGVVSQDENKNLSLNTEVIIPNKGFDEKAFFLGHNISDHLSAATDNVLGKQPPFFERCVHYDGLSEASVDELQAMVADKGMEMLLAVNKRAMQLKAKDVEELGHHQRINIGLYSYHKEEE